MKPQEWYDVALNVKIFGVDNEKDITRGMMMRTGRWYPWELICSINNCIEQEAKQHGYRQPLDYIEDYFQGMFSTSIPIMHKEFDVAEVRKAMGLGPLAPASPGEPAEAGRPEELASKKKKRSANPGQSEKSGNGRLKLARPVLTIPPPERFTSPLLSHVKSNSKRGSHQSAKRRVRGSESNAFRSKERASEICTAELKKHPLMAAYFNNFDYEFRKVMSRIRRQAGSKTKGKTQYLKDFEVLKKYFEKKLSIDLGDAGSSDKFRGAVSYLMKKIQAKLFNSTDPEADRLFVFLKTQLCLFYKYYEETYAEPKQDAT